MESAKDQNSEIDRSKYTFTATYFVSRVYVSFSIAVFFLRGGSTFDCVTVLVGSEVAMVTREMAITGKESLGPETAHTVLTAGK